MEKEKELIQQRGELEVSRAKQAEQQAELAALRERLAQLEAGVAEGGASWQTSMLKLRVRLLMRNVDPATLAAEIAAVDDRDVQIRRKELAAFQPRLVFLYRTETFEAHIPEQLPQQTLVGFEQHSFGKSQVHGRHSSLSAV